MTKWRGIFLLKLEPVTANEPKVSAALLPLRVENHMREWFWIWASQNLAPVPQPHPLRHRITLISQES